MYKEIFKEIHHIMQHDYAGWMETKNLVKAADVLQELQELNESGELNDQTFSHVINKYLLNYQDKHVYFITDNEYTFSPTYCGFSVIRHENSLFVTATYEETNLQVGTEIIEIDGKSIEQNAKENANFLRDEIIERQQWGIVLNKASSLTIKKADGNTEQFLVSKHEYTTEQVNELKVLENDIIYFKLSRFEYSEQLEVLINEVMELAKQHSKLILDLRDNGGGNAGLLNPLIPYFFSSSEKPSINIPNRLFNCTENNVDAFIQFIEEMRPQITDQDTIDMLNFAVEEFNRNKGKGFISLDFTKLLQSRADSFKGNDYLSAIVILTNSKTASASEENVGLCKQSSKVTIIGQATCGINDYSDLVYRKWEEGKFVLNYPISKVEDFTAIHPIHGKGIHPDLYVPFSVENLQKDAELEIACQYLSGKVVVR